MPRYRHALPQLNGQPVLTDGGMETVLVFHEGIDLPHFASYPVLRDDAGRGLITRYYDEFVALAKKHAVGLELGSTTWRASPDWVEKIDGSRDATAGINRQAIDFLTEYRDAQDRDAQKDHTPMPVSGSVGPRGDGYVPGQLMTPDQAAEYHRPQIEAITGAGADLISVYTLNYTDEATGIARAAATAGIPAALSFTLETDGRLPDGQPLGEAIQQVDGATDAAPAYYMINCAHPTHFADAIESDAPWIGRLRGLRANASKLSHAELDAATELDEGDPGDLGSRVGALVERLPAVSVLGGCCGTDFRHVAAIAQACFG